MPSCAASWEGPGSGGRSSSERGGREDSSGLPLETSMRRSLAICPEVMILLFYGFIRSGLNYEHHVRIGTMSNLCALLNNMVT